MSIARRNLIILIMFLLSSVWLLPSVKASSWVQAADPQYPNSWALQFNGKNTYIDLGSAPQFQQQNLTIEICIKLAKTVQPLCNSTWNITSIGLFEYRGPLSNGRSGYCLDFVTTSGRLAWARGELGANTWQGFDSTNDYWANDTWYWLAVVVNPTVPYDNVLIYVNGTLDSSFDSNIKTQYNNDENLIIGWINYDNIDTNWDTFHRYFNGTMGEICLWNESRTQAQILGDMKGLNSTELASNSLVGYWKLNDSSGSIAHDSSIYRHDGTIYDGVWVQVPEVPEFQSVMVLPVLLSIVTVLVLAKVRKREKKL